MPRARWRWWGSSLVTARLLHKHIGGWDLWASTDRGHSSRTTHYLRDKTWVHHNCAVSPLFGFVMQYTHTLVYINMFLTAKFFFRYKYVRSVLCDHRAFSPFPTPRSVYMTPDPEIYFRVNLIMHSRFPNSSYPLCMGVYIQVYTYIFWLHWNPTITSTLQ